LAVVVDPDKFLVLKVVLGRKRSPQQAIKAIPRGCALATLSLGDHAAVAIEGLPAQDFHTEMSKRCVDAGENECLLDLPVGDEAGAAPGEVALHALEDLDVPSGPPQQQAGEQAAHRAADDQCSLVQ
jgi:hypothetical protein